ncbi:beta-propeller fold lactonase family protein [Pectobacterium parmentieri]|uniref:beta-propeller fold lactonase family protein n=1 Tax=Pectobacterium parmentieri TaxID=1905730 RepID=UPI0018E0C8AE|nr:beta-propeller fold lactonase family protein [Pectobacterium parmentieri]QQA75205.1 beta-propeller fold lactonase family protein [Pectobacterium parmentieri]
MTFSRSKSGSALTRPPRQAWVLEPRMMFDAAAVATVADVITHVAATETAPGVDATPVKATITITDTSGSFTPTDLFSGVSVSADNDGQELKDLVITVNRTGANQALVIDGKSIALEAGSGLTRADNDGFSYHVAVSGDTTTITVNIDSFTDNLADAKALIDGIAYKPLNNTVAGGDVVVTLKSLSDEGGTSADTADLNIHATITIDSKINVAPVVSGETLLEAESLTTGTDVAYSSDGKQAYVAGSDNTLTIFTVGESGHLTQKQSLTVENLGHVNHMVVSADGKSLYTISSNGNLMQFSLQNGTPSHTATISVGAGSNGGLAIADDGSQIYVDASGGYGREVFVYQRNTETGELTRTDSLRHRNGVIATAGEYVYIAHSGAIINDNHELQVYQRDSVGKLTLLGSISLGIKGQDPVDYAMAASVDGKSVYIANPKTNDITLYRVGGDNALTLVNTFSTPPIGSLVLNAEGTRLYAAATDGMVSVYAVSSTGALTLVGQAAGSTTGGDLALSQDGRSLLVAGEGVSRYSTLLTQIRGSDAAIASGITLSDANFDALNAGNGNYGGMQLIVSRDGSASDKDIFSFSNTSDLRLDSGQIFQGDRAIATFSQSGGILTIAFLPGTSRAEANAVLHQVTYQNTDTVAGGSVVTLSLRANDGKVDSLPVTLAVLVTTNTAPILAVEAVPLSNYDTTATVVNVFTNTQITAGEAGQKILDITLKVGGLEQAANEFLVIDGTRIDLSKSGEGTTASGYTYTYALNDGSGTLEIHHATGMTIAAAQALINDVAYTNETTQATSGNRTVTLVSVRDDGGAAGQGEDTATLNVAATLTLAINNAPTIQTDIPVDPNLYYSDGLLTGYDSHVSSIVLSDDGRTLLVIGTTAANYGGDARVSLYQRDPDTGKLTLLQRLVAGTDDGDASNGTEVSGLIGRAAVFSDDGSTVYLSANSEVLVFSKDANTGMLSLTARVDGLAGNVLKMTRSDDGKSLYALTAGTLYHYTIGDSGTLSNPATFTQVDGTTPIGLSVDANGTVYVLGNSGKITIYTTIANGALSYAGQLVRGSDGVTLTYTDSGGTQKFAGTLATSNELNHANSAFTVTDEGYIYVVTSNVGNQLTVLHYDSSTNAIERVEARSFSNPWGVTASADGKTLYVGSNNGAVTVYAIGSDGKLTQTGTLAAGRPVTTLTLSEDGKSLYTGARYFNTGVMVSSALVYAPYSAVSASTPFAQGIAFSDIDMDGLSDYQGITLTITRSGGVSADDVFGLAESQDLTLEEGSLLLNGNKIADVKIAEGTITVSVTASISKTVANRILQQVTYRNSAETVPTRIDMVIKIGDGNKSATLSMGLILNNAPEATDTELTLGNAQVGTHYEVTLPDALFSDKENDPFVLSVEGLPEGLSFDAANFTISGMLENGQAGQYELTVKAADTNGGSAERHVTLTVDGDPTQMPTLGGESSSLKNDYAIDGYDPNSFGDVLVGVKDSQLSADGKTLYVVSSPDSGSAVLSVFIRNEEGKFTLSQTFFNYHSVYNNETEQNDKIVDNAGLAGASDVLLSSDGQYLYVVGSEDNAVTLFRVGSDGELTQAGILNQAALGGHSLDVRTHIVSRGDYLFITAAQPNSENDERSVLVFKREADGKLTSVSQADDLIGASRLVLDPTGRYLFVSGSGGTVGVTAFSISDQGVLAQASQLTGTGEYYINGLALSPDGKTLYAINADGIQYTLNTITVGANGALSLTDTTSITDDGGDTGEALATGLVVSADGTALFVIGKNITVFSRAEDGSLTWKDTISGSWDSPIDLFFSDLRNVEMSADGKQLYLIGGDKIHVLDIGTAGATYTEGNDATVLLPSGRLSDPQLDALNNGEGNYNRASITVGRQDGGLQEDIFGLKPGNGLTLDGDNIVKNGTAIATFTQVNGVLTVKFIDAATKADAQNVLRQITYLNSSKDPEQAGSSPTFTFSINDGDNNTASSDITVDLIGINNPAELNTTVLNPQIPGNGEFVKLFKDTNINTIESGQDIWQVVLTFDKSGPNEVINVEGNTIVLVPSSGAPRTANGMQYSVSVNSEGKATVILYASRGSSETAALIDSISYNHLGSDTSGVRHITLMVKEHQYSGTAPETTLEQSITVTLAPAAEANTAPVITVPVTTPTYTERADPIVLAPDATVSDKQMDKLNGGKGNYDGATLKVTLGDGKTALDKIGFNAGNGLTLSGDTLQKDGVTIGQVSNKDGVLTIRFNADASTIPTTEDVQNVLRQITYASDSHTPAAQVAVTVTLADRYLVSQVTALTIDITQINDVPAVNTDPVLSFGDLDRLQTLELSAFGLTGSTNSAVSADGSRVYIADRQGHIALFTRNADGSLTHMRTSAIASGVIQLQMTSDGANLYALQRNSSEGIIVTFTLDSEGNLTEQSSLKQIWDAAQITLSDDGKSLYLMDRETVIVYGRDTTTGTLTRIQALDNDMSRPPYLWAPTEVITQGDKVYVVTNPSNGSSLIVYQRNSETGQLTPLAYLHSGETDSTGKVVNLDYVQHLSISADGQTIFIANSRTSSFTWEGEIAVTDHPMKIDAFRLNAAGTLTHLGTINGTATVEDISLSADDKTLYVALSDGSLAYYSADTLERIDAQNNLANAQKIAVSPRGELIILADALVVLHQTPLSAFYSNGGSAVAAVPTLTLSDAELDAADGGAGDYRGASVVFQRSESPSSNDRFELIAGNGFTVAGNVISKDGQPVATLSQADGRASVTFTASLSRDEATALVRQIGWRSTVVVNESSVALRVVLNDGVQDSTPYETTVTISDSVNQAPVGNSAAFTPPVAQVGTRWTYTLPDSLFTDPENDVLTFTVDSTRLPDGVRFDSATRTLSGTPSTAGSFNLTITATDSAGNATALNVTLAINAASTPVDPGTPTDPDTTTATPVILVHQGVSLPADASEREREQPLGAIVADLSRSETQPSPTNTIIDAVRQGDADTARQSDAPWVLDPVMSQLMPTLEQVNFSSRANTAVRDGATVSPADSNLFLSVRGQATALESAFSSVQGALQPDASGALTFSLPQRMFSVREGNATLTLQLANGRPLPAWVQFDARSGVVSITDASAVQVNQIQLVLKAQAADGTSRTVPITLQTGQGEGATMATGRGAMQLPSHATDNRDVERVAPAGKTAFTEQLRQHQPEQDALLAALGELSSLRA